MSVATVAKRMVEAEVKPGYAVPGDKPDVDNFCFANAPEDTQALVQDFITDEGHPEEVASDALQFMFRIFMSPVSKYPVEEIGTFDGDDRDMSHVKRMETRLLPPTILWDGEFKDGKHRAMAAKERGFDSVAAVDLGEFFKSTGIKKPKK